MTRLLLIRHATNDTVGKSIAGRMPGVLLNEEGNAQANKLADRLQHIFIDAVYSSPLERAVETAGPIVRRRQLSTEVRNNFIELDWGEWTGRSIEDLRNEPLFKRFNTFRSGTRIPGGETMLDAQTRMIAGLQDICLQHPAKTVAVFSHADIIKAAIAFYAGIPLDLSCRFEISPASVSIVDLFDETARIYLLNHTGKLGNSGNHQ